jgi:hypothetical protein
MMDEIETAITMTTSTNNLNTTPTFSSSVSSMSFIPSTQCVNQVAPAPPMEIYGFRFSQEVIPDPPPRRFILKKKNSLIKTYQRAIKKRSSRTVNKKKFKTKLSTEVTVSEIIFSFMVLFFFVGVQIPSLLGSS